MNSENIKILLADDDKDDCMLFQEALEEIELPTQLCVVHDGTKLMQYLLEHSKLLPDIIFLDLNMPRKNGFTCLEEIKKSRKFNSIPIIIFSTSYNESLADRLYKNGALNYFRKPADFTQLKGAIRQPLVGIREKKIALSSQEKLLV